MTNGLLLWVDDEIELLKAHILFLEKKGYEVVTVSNGNDAIEECRQKTFDLILLDEMMPGLSGLETLQYIKEIQPATPVVMCTKSEEENIMDQAIGSKIADYLIKPVNPSQILLTLKKNIHQRQIVTEVTQTGYQQNFGQISMQIDNCQTLQDWIDVYKRLVRWELELSNTDSSMTEMLRMQKEEANNGFAKFVKKNYLSFIEEGSSRDITMSPDIFKKHIFPLLNNGQKVFFIVVDNFRYDQWRVLAEEIGDLFDIDEQLYMTILPTATQYARNAIFSGLMPNKIAEMFPELWVDEDEEEGKNLNEGRRGRQEPQRGTAHPDADRALPPQGQVLLPQGERLSGSRPPAAAVQEPLAERPQRGGHQLYRHALACSHRVEDGARTRQQRKRLPQHHSLVVPPHRTLRTFQTPVAERLYRSAHHRSRLYPCRPSRQDHRRPQYQYQPAL